MRGVSAIGVHPVPIRVIQRFRATGTREFGGEVPEWITGSITQVWTTRSGVPVSDDTGVLLTAERARAVGALGAGGGGDTLTRTAIGGGRHVFVTVHGIGERQRLKTVGVGWSGTAFHMVGRIDRRTGLAVAVRLVTRGHIRHLTNGHLTSSAIMLQFHRGILVFIV